MRRHRGRAPFALALAVGAAALLIGAGQASASTYAPPHHRSFHGVSDTGTAADVHTFTQEVGAHPAVLEDFYHWDTPLTTGALQRWHSTHTRGILSLSTAPGGQPELISPRQIAHGKGDHYIVRLNQSIAASHQTVYIRLFPEMNGSWNPYSAFNADGTPRNGHSAHDFKMAWRRIVLIVRGGKRWVINRKLHHLGMPDILRAHTAKHHHVYQRNSVHKHMAKPKVAFMWNPQTTGSPAVPGNAPKAYWPGGKYVDWVGADIYSAFAPAAFPALNRFYRHWGHWPFMIGEYSPWDNDVTGSFTKHLFKWARTHNRTHMLVYYRSVYLGSPYDISQWPAARKVIRNQLNNTRRFMPFAPGIKH